MVITVTKQEIVQEKSCTIRLPEIEVFLKRVFKIFIDKERVLNPE